jgi:hypothetical protein
VKATKKWGGNYNCIGCLEYQSKKGHFCTLYKKRLRRGNVPGLWVLPCSDCHRNKTYGGEFKNHKLYEKYKEKINPNFYGTVEIQGMTKLQEFREVIKDSNPVAELMQDGNIKNEDGMPVVYYVDKPNGGSVAYLRYDAVVKKFNEAKT